MCGVRGHSDNFGEQLFENDESPQQLRLTRVYAYQSKSKSKSKSKC